MKIFKKIEGVENLDPENNDSHSVCSYTQEMEIEETTTKNIIARPSKYNGLNEGTKINENGFVVSNEKKKLNQAGKF